MNKKGFTLVELLAVLTILSIILAISVPKVIDFIENTRRESFRKGANLIVSTAKTEYSQNLYNTEFVKKVYEFDKNTETGYKSEEELKIRGNKPSTGTVIINEEGKVAIAVVSHDERYCATKTYEEPEVKVTNYVIGKCNIEIDNELIGENIKINITAEPYNEWSKSKEVEITHNATTKSTLQYQLGTTEGEWIDYKDKFIINKNTTIYARLYTKYGSVENQLTVTKIDTTGPTIDKGSVNVTTKSITSQYAVTDEQSGVKGVTCEYGISKEYGSTGTISNSSCVMSNLKNNTKYYYKINAEDNLGNKSSKEYEEITGDFSAITISSNTSEWSRSKTITVSGETLGSQLQYQLGGTSGTWTNISNGGTFNLTSNTTIYARLWDGVNSSKHATLTITTIDRTAPTCGSWGGESTTWTNGNRTITVGCSDSQSGCKSSTYTVGTYTSTVQTKDVSKVISDKVGNTATCSKTANIYVDKTAPTFTTAIYDDTKIGSVYLSENDINNVILYSSVSGILGRAPYISVSASDNVGIASKVITCSGSNITFTGNGTSKVIAKYNSNEGYSDVSCSITVKDSAGNSVTGSKTFRVGSGWLKGDLYYVNGTPYYKWYYYDSSSLRYLTGYQKLKWYKSSTGLTEKYYYFDETGLMKMGLVFVEGYCRYFIEDSNKYGKDPEGSEFRASSYTEHLHSSFANENGEVFDSDSVLIDKNGRCINCKVKYINGKPVCKPESAQ